MGMPLSAQTFDKFLQQALEYSPYLKANRLKIETLKIEQSSSATYKNPNIEFETSYFEPSRGDSDGGYRIGITQPIRLWGVKDAKDRYNVAMIKDAKAEVSFKKAKFIQLLSFLYLEFTKNKKLLLLADEERRVSFYIYSLAKQRYKLGAIQKGELLSSRIDFLLSKSDKSKIELKVDESYTNLMKLSGVNRVVELDTDYTFTHLSHKKDFLGPMQDRYKSLINASSMLLKANNKSIEWIELSANFEQEPEQRIATIGLSVPLAIFSTKKQKQKRARVDINKNLLLQESVKQKERLELDILINRERRLIKIEDNLQTVLSSEKKLLAMYQYDYKIANINLRELQNIKNSLIKTKKELINTQADREKTVINQNYLQGAYSE
jgi:cobalt-zinc-cadmium efflux system outer membrane protein